MRLVAVCRRRRSRPHLKGPVSHTVPHLVAHLVLERLDLPGGSKLIHLTPEEVVGHPSQDEPESIPEKDRRVAAAKKRLEGRPHNARHQ